MKPIEKLREIVEAAKGDYQEKQLEWVKRVRKVMDGVKGTYGYHRISVGEGGFTATCLPEDAEPYVKAIREAGYVASSEGPTEEKDYAVLTVPNPAGD